MVERIIPSCLQEVVHHSRALPRNTPAQVVRRDGNAMKVEQHQNHRQQHQQQPQGQEHPGTQLSSAVTGVGNGTNTSTSTSSIVSTISGFNNNNNNSSSSSNNSSRDLIERYRAQLEAQRLELLQQQHQQIQQQQQQQQRQQQQQQQQMSRSGTTVAAPSNSTTSEGSVTAAAATTKFAAAVAAASAAVGSNYPSNETSTNANPFLRSGHDGQRSVLQQQQQQLHGFRTNDTPATVEPIPLIRTWNGGVDSYVQTHHTTSTGAQSAMDDVFLSVSSANTLDSCSSNRRHDIITDRNQHTHHDIRSGVSHHLHHSGDDVDALNNNVMINHSLSPPVAPAAIVMDCSDNRGTSSSLSSSYTYSYPVASFVTNLVRSGIDSIQNSVVSAIEPRTPEPPQQIDTIPLYIRTESDGDHHQQNQNEQQQHLGIHHNFSYQQYHQPSAQSPSHHHFVSPDTMLAQETQYIVVDGNIYEQSVPQTQHQVEQEYIESMLREQQMMDDNITMSRACQPKKVKRGMRRAIVKLFKRSNKTKQQEEQMRSAGVAAPGGGGVTSAASCGSASEYSVSTAAGAISSPRNSQANELAQQLKQHQNEIRQHLLQRHQQQQQQHLPHHHVQQQQLQDYTTSMNTSTQAAVIPASDAAFQSSQMQLQQYPAGNQLKQALPHQNESQSLSTTSTAKQQNNTRKLRGRWNDSRSNEKLPATTTDGSTDSSSNRRSTDSRNDGNRKHRGRWVGRRNNDKKALPSATIPQEIEQYMDTSQQSLPSNSMLLPASTGLNIVPQSVAECHRNVIPGQSALQITPHVPPPPSTLSPQTSGFAGSPPVFDNAYRLVDSISGVRRVNDNVALDELDGLHPVQFAELPRSSPLEGRAQSVTASFVGTCDAAGLPPSVAGLLNAGHHDLYGGLAGTTVHAAETLLETTFSSEDCFLCDDYDAALRKKEDECSENYTQALAAIHAPREDTDIKVDKADAPDVEDMLRRAVIETTTDLEATPDHHFDLSEYLPRRTPTNSNGGVGAIGSSSVGIPQPHGALMISASSSSSSFLKSDFDSVPLSKASASDELVHNDILKVVMVSAPTVDKSWLARALAPRKARKGQRNRSTLGLVIHEWKLSSMNSNSTLSSEHIKCVIWDVQGAKSKPDDAKANFGVHPATQSLFFSSQSLYLLVWDLACNNPKTFRRDDTSKSRVAAGGSINHVNDNEDDDSDEEDDEDDDNDDEFLKEEANKQADRALHADITHRVLSWVDCIAVKGPMSAILPVALIPDEGMSTNEVKRRCDMLQSMLEMHVQKSRDNIVQPILLTTVHGNVACVKYNKDGSLNSKEPIEGIEQLQELVMGIATDTSHSVFTHVGTDVPQGTVLVWDCIQRFKQDHKLILLDHLLFGLESLLDQDSVVAALQFLSSIGEILYFGTSDDEVLSRYIILCPKWLVSALSCILRNDFKREIEEARQFMNMQCLYFKDSRYEKNELIEALVHGEKTDSNMPLLSDDDAKALWQSISFMREAADRCASGGESSSTSAPTMFDFLVTLLVHSGILLPIEQSSSATSNLDRPQNVFFVPSLLSQANPTDIWTYKSGEAWTTTLCHSWLFRDGAPANLMENIVVKLVRDLYDFKKDFPGMPQGERLNHARTSPLLRRSFDNFMDEHDNDKIGQVRIHQLMCWESSLLIKIGTVFSDLEKGQLRESFVEIFVAVCDLSSTMCVASDIMRPNMQRVIVSGKGEAGHEGRKLWKGGYQVVLDSVRCSLSSHANVDAQVICRDCLAHSKPSAAATFSWDSVCAAAQSSRGSGDIFCQVGHCVPSSFLCGTRVEASPRDDSVPTVGTVKPVSDILPSVVLVGLWNRASQSLASVGSGYVVDKKLGLIVTAAHVLFSMDKGPKYGSRFMGIPDARVVIGVHPEDDERQTNKKAVFRYWAEIVVDGISENVDACVLRIVSRLVNDVDDEGSGCGDQEERPISSERSMAEEKLRPLKLTEDFEREESVRILGYSQGGEGLFDVGTHVNRVADFVKFGYICMKFVAPAADDIGSRNSSMSSNGSDNVKDMVSLQPREEIVVNNCATISGHSGGPCVNNAGYVLGILSRSDPVDRRRCYLVPASKLKALIRRAKKEGTVSTALLSSTATTSVMSIETSTPYYQSAATS